MQVKSIAECSTWSILQYFQPSLRYHLSLRSLFCVFLIVSFTQVLLYLIFASYSMFYPIRPNKPAPVAKSAH